VNESLVLVIGDLAWPVTVLAIAVLVLITQQEPVGRLIDRMKKVSFPGGQAELAAVPEAEAHTISAVLESLSDGLGVQSPTTPMAIENREPVRPLVALPAAEVKTLPELRALAANMLNELAVPDPPGGPGPISGTIDVLRRRGVLTTEQAKKLNEMIEVADRAASGAVVPPLVESAVRNSGGAILSQLDLLGTVAARTCEEYVMDTLRQRTPEGWVVDFDRGIPRQNPDSPPARVDALVTAGNRSVVVEMRARLRPFAVGQVEQARELVAALPARLPVLIVMLGQALPDREQEQVRGDHEAPVEFLLWDVEAHKLISKLRDLIAGADVIPVLAS
jgi:hypothetical protein